MADPFTAAAIIGATGAVASGVGGALAPGGSPQAKLPPEMEAQQLEIIQQSIDDMNKERERTSAIADTLTERGNLLIEVEKGLIPEKDALARITKQNQLIAEKFGSEILTQVGELSGDLGFESKLREAGVDMLGKPLAEYKDPTVEREISEGKQALTEQLQHDLGPGWATSDAGIRAMRQFDQSSTEMRATASRSVRSEELGKLTALTNVGASVVGTRLNAGQGLFQGRQSAFNDLMAGMNSSAGRNMLTTASQTGATTLDMGNTAFGQMTSFGQQNLSGDIIKSIEGGNFMPEFQTFGEAGERGVVKNYYGGFGKGSPNKDQYYGRW
jgi:hypothetical protein